MKKRLKVCEVAITYKSKVKPSQRPKLSKSKEVFNLLSKMYDENTVELKEYFKVVLLDQSNKVLGYYDLSFGGIDGTYVDVRHVMQVAILANATGIIITHNHPSGNPTPSVNDRRVTNQIKKASDIMNIRLVDHIIMTRETFYSFADEGDLI